MEVIIANVFLSILMLMFSIFIFKNVIKRINQSAKKWFIDKLQEYNYLVEEKEEELESLRKQIEEAKRKVKIAEKIQEEPENIFSTEIENKLEKMKLYRSMPSQVPRRPEVVYDIPTPQYKEASFFQNYKQLKKKFNISPKKIILEFIKTHKTTDNTEEYEILTKFRKKFSDKVLYDCSTLEDVEQYELIKSVLTEEEKRYIKLQEIPTGFSVRNLLNQTEERLKDIDPTIYVYLGRQDVKYDDLDKDVKTYFYKNMSEGVIIQYKGKMYDYSI